MYSRLLYGVLSDGGGQVYGRRSDRGSGRRKPALGRRQPVNFVFFAIAQTARRLVRGTKKKNKNTNKYKNFMYIYKEPSHRFS